MTESPYSADLDALPPPSAPVPSWVRRHKWLTAFAVVAVLLAPTLVLLDALVVEPYSIPAESMEPTLQVGDRILVNRLGDPGVGDVVVFHPPAAATQFADEMCAEPPAARQGCAVPGASRSEESFVKRIVAGPGDTVAIVDEHVVRNGERVDEPYVREQCEDGSPPPDFRRPVRVPDGTFYVLGDNRECSEDSRFWGPIREDWVIGTLLVTYWPPKHMG